MKIIPLLILNIFLLFEPIAAQYGSDSAIASMRLKLENENRRITHIHKNFSKKLDVKHINLELDDVAEKLRFSEIYINTSDTHLSYRLLKVHTVYLEQLYEKLNAYRVELSKYDSEIVKAKKGINKFIGDYSYKSLTNDTLLSKPLLQQYNVLLKEFSAADSINKEREAACNILQSKLISDFNLLAVLHNDLQTRMSYYNKTIFHANDKPLLKIKRSDYSKGLFDVVRDSAETGGKIMAYYLETHWVAVVITITLISLFILWIIFIRREYKKHLVGYVRTSNIRLKYLSANPVFGSLLLTFCFAPFFFPTPPIIFVELVWTILGLILTVLFFKDKAISIRTKTVWSVFFILFRIVALFNLYLYSTFEERWLLLVINIMCFVLDMLILQTNREKHIFHLQRTAYIIYISASMHVLSMLCNFTGLFNLSKILTATATFAVFIAAVLRIFVDTGKEALAFQLAMFKRNSNENEAAYTKTHFYLSRGLEIFAVITWITIFLSNLNFFEYLQSTRLK